MMSIALSKDRKEYAAEFRGSSSFNTLWNPIKLRNHVPRKRLECSGFGGIQEHCNFEGTILVQGIDVVPSQWPQSGTRGQQRMSSLPEGISHKDTWPVHYNLIFGVALWYAGRDADLHSFRLNFFDA